jgi:hypothetical protein
MDVPVRRGVATTSEVAGEVRWSRSASDPTRPWVLQQYWKITEHFSDTSKAIRHEWRDVKVAPPVDDL